ncbi:hypothetical protein PIB30_054395 [Stylosanthes scabra]|uniref:Uncharacterized protein n=1 Tax=Stylosanthes scabra TaxID=79078 RepID=A0ABU6UHI6_9FABA|nr:hypothetical protein [Stylosanthes scabra]
MMVLDVLNSGPTSEAISQIIETIVDFLYYASDVLVKKDSFKELSAYLERISPILKALKKGKVSDSEKFNQAIEILSRKVRDAKQLAEECSKKNKLCENMLAAEFKAAIAEEEILEKIESGIHEKNVDRCYANDLLVLIADAVGITNEKSTMKKELEEFKSEIENAKLRKDLAEAIQMD